MSVTQTVDIPDSHRLVIDVPREVPSGRTILTFTPAVPASDAGLPGGKDYAIEEAIREAEEKAARRTDISQYFGIIKSDAYGDPVAYQRSLRDEWPD